MILDSLGICVYSFTGGAINYIWMKKNNFEGKPSNHELKLLLL